MSSRHQPENGADSQDYGTAETAIVSDDRLSSAGVAPDGVASQTVSQEEDSSRATTAAGGTSADNEPATSAGRAILAASICKCGVAKSYHAPRFTDHQYEPRYNVDAAMIVRVEREAAERASGGLDVRRVVEHFPFSRNGTLYCDCAWYLDGGAVLDWWGHVEVEYARLTTPQPGERHKNEAGVEFVTATCGECGFRHAHRATPQPGEDR